MVRHHFDRFSLTEGNNLSKVKFIELPLTFQIIFAGLFNLSLNEARSDITIILATRLRWCRISTTLKNGKVEGIAITTKKNLEIVQSSILCGLPSAGQTVNTH